MSLETLQLKIRSSELFLLHGTYALLQRPTERMYATTLRGRVPEPTVTDSIMHATFALSHSLLGGHLLDYFFRTDTFDWFYVFR